MTTQSATGVADPTGEDSAPPFRYTAALANEIEARWQDRWEARAPSRRPTRAARWRRPTAPRCPRTSCTCWTCSRTRPARDCTSAIRWLHRHRRHRPLHADDRAQRPAHHRVRRLRPARRAVRRAHRHPPADHDRGQHRPVPGAAAAAGVRARPATQRGHHRPRVLPLDAVDLHPAVRGLVRPGCPPRPADPGPGRRVRRRHPAHARRPAVGRADLGRAAPGAGRPPVGLHRRGAGELVPGLGTVLSNEEVTADGRSAIGNYRSSAATCASG